MASTGSILADFVRFRHALSNLCRPWAAVILLYHSSTVAASLIIVRVSLSRKKQELFPDVCHINLVRPQWL